MRQRSPCNIIHHRVRVPILLPRAWAAESCLYSVCTSPFFSLDFAEIAKLAQETTRACFLCFFAWQEPLASLCLVVKWLTLDVPKETLRAHSRRSIDPCGCLRGAGTIHPRRASYGNYRFLRREAFSLLDCPTETRNFRPPIGVFASALSHQFL